ncbi:hypothetical protein N7539_001967 [Penicillium diatomitis]|uniref:Uncharacterized protein n=1 Tax=Penicillium diatomitis TaxID=2819901 RepID=A0A9W9XHQ4_9EURO|nr:uncharacterized protein N7539_001967 [Penicillium diatomitis]KAJ5493221.1 hypothetical protein N7539_001967 [Penicillium diatomitis]
MVTRPPLPKTDAEALRHYLRAWQWAIAWEESRRGQELEKSRQEAMKLERRKIEHGILVDALCAGMSPDLCPALMDSMNGLFNGRLNPDNLPQDLPVSIRRRLRAISPVLNQQPTQPPVPAILTPPPEASDPFNKSADQQPQKPAEITQKNWQGSFQVHSRNDVSGFSNNPTSSPEFSQSAANEISRRETLKAVTCFPRGAPRPRAQHRSRLSASNPPGQVRRFRFPIIVWTPSAQKVEHSIEDMMIDTTYDASDEESTDPEDYESYYDDPHTGSEYESDQDREALHNSSHSNQDDDVMIVDDTD